MGSLIKKKLENNIEDDYKKINYKEKVQKFLLVSSIQLMS